jgi:hypothetical protein
MANIPSYPLPAAMAVKGVRGDQSNRGISPAQVTHTPSHEKSSYKHARVIRPDVSYTPVTGFGRSALRGEDEGFVFLEFRIPARGWGTRLVGMQHRSTALYMCSFVYSVMPVR